MTPTADPNIMIEEQRVGYVRYYRKTDGRRWTVTGVCDRRGDCMVGVVVDGVQIKDKTHLAQLVAEKGKPRIDSELDVPVTPEFKGVCCPFTFRELKAGPTN